ncbi:hypothetical protein BDY24DRAFT_325407, partial [Mrakia frigida]|uniref:bZIP transcription factor n=1 Tax=Mrakia frigida TaxID=29902 RepID=UPI003FCBF927
RRSTAPTGHRKGIVPDQLLSLDAPTQARNYVSESSTSKKKVPAAFEGRKDKETKKQRKGSKNSTTHDDDEPSTSLQDPTSSDLPASLEDAIAAKRRNNTIAARRSRHRKLAHLQGLESLV